MSDFDGFDSEFDIDSIGDIGLDGLNETDVEGSLKFDFEASSEEDGRPLSKTVAILIIAAIFILGFVAIFWGRGYFTGERESNLGTEEIEQARETNNVVDEAPIESKTPVVTVKPVTNNDGWIEITDKESIQFNKEYVELTFTVTNIKNYAKVISDERDIRVKTVLSGSLSGLTGVHELEIPYRIGSQLSKGSSFGVKVEMGDFDGKTVIGDIKY